MSIVIDTDLSLVIQRLNISELKKHRSPCILLGAGGKEYDPSIKEYSRNVMPVHKNTAHPRRHIYPQRGSP